MELSPSIYEHAAAVISRTPWETSRDEELLFAAHAAAYRLYRHTPIMPGIDIYNLEADRVIGLVKGRPNVCLGTGALPYEAPPDNVLRLREYASGF